MKWCEALLIAYKTNNETKNFLAVYLSGLREGDRLTFILLYKSSSKRVNIRCLKYSPTGGGEFRREAFWIVRFNCNILNVYKNEIWNIIFIVRK